MWLFHEHCRCRTSGGIVTVEEEDEQTRFTFNSPVDDQLRKSRFEEEPTINEELDTMKDASQTPEKKGDSDVYEDSYRRKGRVDPGSSTQVAVSNFFALHNTMHICHCKTRCLSYVFVDFRERAFMLVNVCCTLTFFFPVFCVRRL